MSARILRATGDGAPTRCPTRWTRGGLIAALAMSALFAAGTSSAQQQQAQPAQNAPQAALEEVVVTGSRIAAPNETSTSPIQVISSASIATSGKTDISDIISQLPQNFNNGIGQDLGGGAAFGLVRPGIPLPLGIRLGGVDFPISGGISIRADTPGLQCEPHRLRAHAPVPRVFL